MYILRTARAFWNCCKNGGGNEHLALESHLIHSSIISSMKTKVDINCFFQNSVFLIGPKNDDCAEEKPACGHFFLFCFVLFCGFFFFLVFFFFVVFFFFGFFFGFFFFFCLFFFVFCCCFFFLRFDSRCFPPFLLFFSSFSHPFFSILRIVCIYRFRTRLVGRDLATLPI